MMPEREEGLDTRMPVILDSGLAAMKIPVPGKKK